MTQDEITLLISESSCCEYFNRRLKIIQKDEHTEVITTVKCVLGPHQLTVKSIMFMYLYLYQFHIHGFV